MYVTVCNNCLVGRVINILFLTGYVCNCVQREVASDR